MLLVINLEEKVPEEHPLRPIKQLADAALKELSQLFDQIYSALGRPRRFRPSACSRLRC